MKEKKKIGYWVISLRLFASICISYLVIAPIMVGYAPYKLSKLENPKNDQDILSYDSNAPTNVSESAISLYEAVKIGFQFSMIGAFFMIPLFMILTFIVYAPFTKYLLNKNIIDNAFKIAVWGGVCATLTAFFISLFSGVINIFDIVYFVPGCFAGFIFYHLIKKRLT